MIEITSLDTPPSLARTLPSSRPALRIGVVQHRWHPDAAALQLAGVKQFPLRENCVYNEQEFNCLMPPGNYFMMDDNRDSSSDSRYWGFVPEQNIVGKAFLVWWNFSELRRIGNRIN